MLDRFTPHATLAATDLERAKSWYADKLGMKPSKEDMAGAWYDSGEGTFLLFETPMAGTAKNTTMEWQVEDVAALVADLKGRGVMFETFEMEGIEWNGEVASMGGEQAAWFKDSEGNTLAIST